MMRLCIDPKDIEYFSCDPTDPELQVRYRPLFTVGFSIYARLDVAVLRGILSPSDARLLLRSDLNRGPLLDQYKTSEVGNLDLELYIMYETYVSVSPRPKSFFLRHRRNLHSDVLCLEISILEDEWAVIKRPQPCIDFEQPY